MMHGHLNLEENDFVERLIFCDDATFHISGKVNGHNVRIWWTVTGDSYLDMLENWLLPQLNTNYDDYILHLDGAPPISTEMYECFSIVFFNISGSDVLQKETNTFSLGHHVRRI